MAKRNKVSVNKLEAAAKEVLGQIDVVDWHGLDIEIKHSISFDSVIALIDGIAASCFDDGDYRPERTEYVLRSAVVQLYTNLTLPSNANKQYALLFDTDLYDTVLDHINYSQYNSIVIAVNDKVRYIRQTNINSVQKQINDAMQSLNGLMSVIGDVMNGVTPDDISNLVNAIGENGVDEQKLMQAYINQRYSDIPVDIDDSE